MGLGWGLAWQTALAQFNGRISKNLLRYLFWGIFIASWAGSKLFFILFSKTDYTFEVLNKSSFWLGGGFVFFGGLTFGVLFVYLSSKFISQKVPYQRFLPCMVLGHGIGRIGCFLAGCCFGIPYSGFGHIHLHGEGRIPVQLIEAFFLFFLFFILRRDSVLSSWKKTLGIYGLVYGVGRIVLERMRGDLVRGSLWDLSTSTVIGIILSLLGLFLLKRESALLRSHRK